MRLLKPDQLKNGFYQETFDKLLPTLFTRGGFFPKLLTITIRNSE